MSDNDAEMERGVAQVMNDLAPGAVFSYSRHGVTMKVDKWYYEPIDGIDTNRVADHLAGRVEGFRNSNQSPWSDIGEQNIDFFKVTKVGAEFFPRTLVCKECNAVTFRNEVSSLRKTKGRCPQGCGGRVQQIEFVLVHDCGGLRNVQPSECDRHGWDHLYLQKGSAEDLATWSFRCRKCSPSEYKNNFSNMCECGDYITGVKPVDAGPVHYSQRDEIVEIPPVGVDESDIPYGEEWSRVLMSAHLRNPDLAVEGISLEAVASTPGADDEKIEDYVDKLGEENREIIIEMIRDLTPGDGFSRSTVVQINKKDVNAPEDHNWHTLVAHQLFTFLRCSQGYQGDTDDIKNLDRHPSPQELSDFVEDDEFVQKHLQAKYYPQSLATIGVEDAWVVDNFPLLNLLFGYTRSSPIAKETDLRKFDHPYDENAIAIYGDRSPSEAIVLELDRAAILEWLLESGPLVDGDVPDLDDELAVKRWFLENIDARETQNPFTPIDDTLTELVYTLIHSMSHTLMSTASEQCGLDSDSISEMILPNVPAIVLYAESMEHFALGGLFTLFKTKINDWVSDSKDFAQECIYDPACERGDDGAACHACMHVSEHTCEYYNEKLDRRLLVGSSDIDPFWDVET